MPPPCVLRDSKEGGGGSLRLFFKKLTNETAQTLYIIINKCMTKSAINFDENTNVLSVEKEKALESSLQNITK